MDIITSHIQTDFDSLGSMLAAKLLYPEALIVFPGAQEKSVRDYLMNAPAAIREDMVKLRQVDLDDVKRLIIVDTRQASRIGAFADLLGREGVTVVLYDHHGSSPDDIQGDSEYCEELGSTVALMVKILNQEGIMPSPEIATVMAMGLYEDTGSLLFPSATPDDCMALAALMTWGADMDSISRTISRELSAEQVNVLDQLIKNLRMLEVNGLHVAVSKSASTAYVEDFAILVHKLRGMYVADAFFALGQMGERIYLVARSTQPQLNAAQIAAFFGGGGHASAAAASLKELNLNQAESLLIKYIRQETRPLITARDIMTFPVKGIYLEDSINKASELLNKYHINALIVKSADERVRGMITRQVVSRAQGHDLGEARIRDYMIQDVRTVRPDAPVGEIRSLVIDGNQRLIPVVEDRRAVGVITRTDLMRMLHERMTKIEKGVSAEAPGKSIRHLLMERMPPDLYDTLKKSGELAESMGFNLFLVGGIVRDMVMRIENLDVDLVVEGDGIIFAKALAEAFGGKVSPHEKYKTAVVRLPGGRRIDLATARLEYYRMPGAFPEVEESTLKLDLYRRDFTINTMAVALNPHRFGELIDFFGAQRDIREKKIRVLHSLSFVEDPSRILRAVRFEKRFNFCLGKQTVSLISSAVQAGFLRNIPGRRIFHEMRQILQEENPVRCMDRLHELKVLEAIHPDLVFDERIRESFVSVRETLFWFRLLYTHEKVRPWFLYCLALTEPMNPETVMSIAEALGLRREDAEMLLASRERVRELMKRLASLSEILPSKAFGILEDAALEEMLYAMSRSRSATFKKIFSTYVTSWRNYRPPVSGKDLLVIGFSQNPELGRCLREIRDQGLNGEIRDFAGAMDYARTFLRGLRQS
ncbi:CBS domain-containing protein [Syntrophus aciditrophicus]|uniref:tRNA nucleotidyltransferase n=1 Tax=Syntrophus aciditrophicus (strain SB) TaxID=56780 RepID=Q2LR14_SYNAS|nr:CBS domain-containing protein [Syntrophus aciditrophicus]ABC76522.1 tRNA nucleotidyltransferase [Syntrophus aciditrophicus SB]OPY18322.1 MAG: Multifunctional CCA protein [Syntrophus sp. PtaB.Bin075]